MDSKILKSKISNIPKKPGIYQFLGSKGEVLYVGKAKNLNSRVKQYFQNHDTRPQLPYLLAEAVDINYTVVATELESAFLENTLIKQYSPKYNIDLKDDKNYAFIKIDYSTEIPQIGYARNITVQPISKSVNKHRKKSKIQNLNTKTNPKSEIINHKSLYFGPYSAVYKIRNTLNLVRKIFPYCASDKVGSRPCFYYYMHRCPGVCIGKISIEEYNQTLDKIIKFLQGNNNEVVKDLEKEMKQAAKAKKFETAARLRDQFKALQILTEKQNVILTKKVDWDIISLASESGFSCVNLFKIRSGKMFDKESFVYESPAIPTQGRNPDQNVGAEVDTIERFLEQYYLDASSIPQVIYSEVATENQNLIKQIIKSRFNKNIKIEVPKKGQLAKLVALGKENAIEYLKNWLNAKAGNLDKINASLTQLKETLGLSVIPKRIECFDISNIQGTNAVASMVVFKDGLPAKNEYRKFKIQTKQTPDDFAMMHEALTRRLARSWDKSKIQNLNSKIESNPKSFWPVPDLIVIDGGKGQLSAVYSIIQNSKLNIPVIGLAKRIEEIFLPEQSSPIILDHNQPALQLLQRLRDEAHRFGITFHRQLRSKQAIKSALDDVPGIGPKLKKLLKQKIGTVADIKNSSQEELAKLVGEKLALNLKKYL